MGKLEIQRKVEKVEIYIAQRERERERERERDLY